MNIDDIIEMHPKELAQVAINSQYAFDFWVITGILCSKLSSNEQKDKANRLFKYAKYFDYQSSMNILTEIVNSK